MHTLAKLAAVLLIGALAGCATTTKDYAKFNAASPRSILVVPVVNKSADKTAPDYLLSTIAIPLVDQGYYVFPVNMVKKILEDEGLSNADLVHSVPAQKLCGMFGADAVLYAAIEEWNAEYVLIGSYVTVGASYVIKDCRNGDTLWEDKENISYTTSNTGSPRSGIVILDALMLMAAFIPHIDYLPAARKANAEAFAYPGPGIPPGPYASRAN